MAERVILATAPLRGPGLDVLRGLGEVVLDPWIDHRPLRLYGSEQLAARAAGLVGSLDEGAALFSPRTTTLVPDAALHEHYEQTYASYVELTSVLKPVMHRSVIALEKR